MITVMHVIWLVGCQTLTHTHKIWTTKSLNVFFLLMLLMLLNASGLISSHVLVCCKMMNFSMETFVDICTISWEIFVSRNHRPNGMAVAKIVRLHHIHSHKYTACKSKSKKKKTMWASFYSVHRFKPIFMDLIKQTVAVSCRFHGSSFQT